MANKLYEESSVQAIANAIRAKNGTTTKYKIGEMGGAVMGITGGEDTVTVTSSIEHYIRISLPCTDASAVIATINEQI